MSERLCPTCRQKLPHLDGVAFAARNGVVIVDGVGVQLSCLQLKLLEALWSASPSYLDRAALLTAGWGKYPPMANCLNTRITIIRRKMRQTRLALRAIYKIGYRAELAD